MPSGRSGIVLVGQQHVLKEGAEATLWITHMYFEKPLSNFEWADCRVKCGRKPGEANT
jgi:hypothetical protein